MRLSDAFVFAHQMGAMLADGVKLAFKGLIFHAPDGAFANEKLLK